MKIKNGALFYSCIGIAAFLLLSAFIPISVDTGFNYIVQDTLLGIIIFHNIFIFSTIILLLAVGMARSVSWGK